MSSDQDGRELQISPLLLCAFWQKKRQFARGRDRPSRDLHLRRWLRNPGGENLA